MSLQPYPPPSMSERYFVDEPITAERVTLSGPESHHLIHVMRAAPGVRVTLFDGGGDEFPAVVERVGRSEVELSVVSRERIDRELPCDLTIGVALPKGDRQKWLVEKAVELGVTRIVPLVTRRSVAQPVDQALVRLRRAVVEASKQCGRNRLMQIDQPSDWPAFVASAPVETCRLLAHPGVDNGEWKSKKENGMFFAAVGPEGGFDDGEVSLALEAGWLAVNLGPRILRVETAALALAAVVAAG